MVGAPRRVMGSVAKARLQLHFCVFLWGFTSILGKLITLPAFALVWWRMLFVVVALLLWPPVRRGLTCLTPRLVCAYACIGVVVALHWVTFYGAIKLANASIAVTCIALVPVFLAFVEPLAQRRSFDPRELLVGAAAVPGVAMVVGAVPSGMRLGICVGIVSALLVAVFGAYNKRFIGGADPLTITCIELGSGTLLLSLLAPFWPHSKSFLAIPGLRDALLLVILAMGCTLLPFALSLAALRHLSAYSTQLIVNLEPVYAILLAMLLLGEQHELGRGFYAGVAIILTVALAHPVMRRFT
jgi:drug/metabolite transporter (DMT)-like permease